MKFIKSIVRFIRYNEYKSVSLLCWWYSAIYRFQVLHMDTKKLRKKWGFEGEESPDDEAMENYRYAKAVSMCVNHVCNKTAWESKCLVRALTAQKLLKRKGIQSTMYLGCGMDEGKMVAHAWLRCGRMYVTGGNGEEYAVVDKFRA
ncbi:MAG: lasso peptide biosynthesis B2 protein [Lachnospiraceae bacterium]|nr:lasso peptide biosynthesis B2 protein [Lachnospiraceae bacterium]